MCRWLKDGSLIKEMCKSQEAISVRDGNVQRFDIHGENIIMVPRETNRVGNTKHVFCIFQI